MTQSWLLYSHYRRRDCRAHHAGVASAFTPVRLRLVAAIATVANLWRADHSGFKLAPCFMFHLYLGDIIIRAYADCSGLLRGYVVQVLPNERINVLAVNTRLEQAKTTPRLRRRLISIEIPGRTLKPLGRISQLSRTLLKHEMTHFERQL